MSIVLSYMVALCIGVVIGSCFLGVGLLQDIKRIVERIYLDMKK